MCMFVFRFVDCRKPLYVFCFVFVTVYLFSCSLVFVYYTNGICVLVFSGAPGDCVWSSMI